MKRRNKTVLKIVGILSLCCLLTGAFCFHYWQKINHYTSVLSVQKGQFLDAINLTRIEDVEKILGLAADHEFTIYEKNHEYVLLSCSLSKGYKATYCFLFEDGILKNIIPPIYYSEQPRIWDINESTRIRGIMNAKGLSKKEIIEEINRPSEKINGMEPWSILPAIFLTGGYFIYELPMIANDYKNNCIYKKEYNGLLVRTGMSLDDVNKLMGHPIRYFVNNHDEVRIYGNNRSLKVNPLLEFSGMAIVFHENRVIKVLSNSFFNSKWKNE